MVRGGSIAGLPVRPLKKVRVISVTAGHSSSALVTADVTMPRLPWEPEISDDRPAAASPSGADHEPE